MRVTEPTRAFWQVDPRNRFVRHRTLSQLLWHGSDAKLPDDPAAFVAAVAEALWAPETRAAVSACAALVDRPSLRIIRRICHRTGAQTSPVAAVFGWLPAARDPRVLVPVDDPATVASLPYGDHETIASFAAYRALGGHLLAGLLVGDPLRDEPRRVIYT